MGDGGAGDVRRGGARVVTRPGGRRLLAAVLLSLAACGDGEPEARPGEAGGPDGAPVAEGPAAEPGLPGTEGPEGALPRAPLRADTYPADWLLLDAWSPDGEPGTTPAEPPAGPGDAPEPSFPAVELRVDAERDEAGRIMWDDGHRWLLVVREGPLSARLVDEFVPAGVVRFWVVDDQEGGLRIVTEVDSGTAGVRTTAWVRAPDGDAWTATGQAEASGNLLHRTRPDLLR